MSKAIPRATLFQKWLHGIDKAAANDIERLRLRMYIEQMQLAKVYESEEIPQEPQNLSQKAQGYLCAIDEDLQEYCRVMRERVQRNRENGLKDPKQPHKTPQDPSGVQETPQDPTNPTQPTREYNNQNNTIQNNTIQSNYKGAEKVGLFDLGLFLLSQGYIVTPDKLRSVYANACSARRPQAYAAKAFEDSRNGSAQHGEGLQVANFVRATKCTDLQALGVYGVTIEGETLAVRCTKAAEAAIGEQGTQNALQGYAKAVGCNTIIYFAQ